MNIKNIFSYQNLFQFNSAFISPQEKLFAFLGAVLILIGIVLKVSVVLSSDPVEKKYRSKFYHIFLTTGILEVFWYLCRYENVTFFGTKFMAFLYLLMGIVWFVLVSVATFKNYCQEKVTQEKENLKKKYLPA